MYMAPEVHKNEAYQGSQIDIFSSGIILFTLVSGRFPFDGEATEGNKLFKYISKKQYDKFWNYHIKEAPECSIFKSANFRDLFQAMVALIPDERPTLEAITQHPWVTDPDTAPHEDISKYFDLKDT